MLNVIWEQAQEIFHPLFLCFLSVPPQIGHICQPINKVSLKYVFHTIHSLKSLKSCQPASMLGTLLLLH